MLNQSVAPITAISGNKDQAKDIAAQTIANAGVFQRAVLAGYGGAICADLTPDVDLERDFQRVFSQSAPREYWDCIDGMEARKAVEFQQEVAVQIYRQRMAQYAGGAR